MYLAIGGNIMFRNIFVSILIITSSFIISVGQSPERKEPEKAAQIFSFTFDGDGGYLGVQTVEISKDNFAKFGLREVRGVAVEKVIENSPAAMAGLKEGDVIVRFNGDEVTSSRKLTRMVGETDPDHQVKLTILRAGSEQEITATLGKRPMPKFAEGNFNFTMPPMDKMVRPDFKDLPNFKEMPEWKELPKLKESLKDLPRGDMPQMFKFPDGSGEAFVWRSGEGRQIGIGVTPLTKQLAAHFNVEDGILINEVRENSPAAKAGLKAGDIIVETEGNPIKGDFDIIKAINGKKEGDITITYVRDGKRQTVSVTPEKSKNDGFLFEKNDGINEQAPAAPMVLFRNAVPAKPPIPPAPMTLFRSGRII